MPVVAPRPRSVVVLPGVRRPSGSAIMVPPTTTVDYGQPSEVGSDYQEYGYYMSLLMGMRRLVWMICFRMCRYLYAIISRVGFYCAVS